MPHLTPRLKPSNIANHRSTSGIIITPPRRRRRRVHTTRRKSPTLFWMRPYCHPSEESYKGKEALSRLKKNFVRFYFLFPLFSFSFHTCLSPYSSSPYDYFVTSKWTLTLGTELMLQATCVPDFIFFCYAPPLSFYGCLPYRTLTLTLLYELYPLPTYIRLYLPRIGAIIAISGIIPLSRLGAG